jgi:hypothetical protein
MTGRFAIVSLGNHDLPDDVASATDADVESTLRRAATFLGFNGDDVTIERVASVIPGTCMACTEIVASVGGTRMLVATPALY